MLRTEECVLHTVPLMVWALFRVLRSPQNSYSNQNVCVYVWQRGDAGQNSGEEGGKVDKPSPNSVLSLSAAD